MIGTTLSHYRIVEELGRGGMGIVYKAEDTKLDRTVAIKVLPSAALASKDDRDRFYREAKAAAALNHPHIAQVYEIDEAVPSDAPHGTDPSPFIAMEFIDGRPLDEELKERPLKLERAVALAIQMAQALEAAHEKNIVHRDIKSANVMLTAKGQAKVLDFGLAKTAHSTMLTRMGSTLGTVAYMSPEQARGEDVDHRTDLWAMGVVLYEMVSGKNPFSGDYEQAVVYSILNEPPEPLTAVRTGVPMQLEWIVDKCLAKQADDRYHSAKDLIVDLKNIEKRLGSGVSISGHSAISGLSATGQHLAAAPIATHAPASGRSHIPVWLWAALPAMLAIGAVTGILLFQEPAPVPPPAKKLELFIPGTQRMFTPNVSNSGRFVVYPAFDGTSNVLTLRVHDLVSGDNRMVETNQVAIPFQPSWSPDDGWLAFINANNANELYKISPQGGTPIEVAPYTDGNFAWADNGDLLYSRTNLYRAPEDGTEPQLLLVPDTLSNERALSKPIPMGDDELIFTAWMDDGPPFVKWVDLSSGAQQIVLRGAMAFLYLEEGFLLYFRVPPGADLNNIGFLELTAQRFDRDTREVYGPPLLVSGASSFSDVSSDGTLFVAPTAIGQGTYSLFWLSPDGTQTPLGIDSGNYDDLALSPDGSKLAIEVARETNTDIFLVDLESGSRQRFSFDVNGMDPAWSPDGRTIAFSSNEINDKGIYLRPADGSGPARLVKATLYDSPVPEFFPDGQRILYIDLDEASMMRTLRILDVETGQSTPIPNTNHAGAARPSPDGRYVTYVQSTQQQTVRVSSLDGAEQFEVAEENAHYPRWSADGTRIYYRRGSSYFYRNIELAPRFRLVGDEVDLGLLGPGFDHFPSPVNNDVLISIPTVLSSEAAVRLTVVTNWVDWLEEQLPAR